MKFVKVLFAWLSRHERQHQAREMNKKAWNDIDFIEDPQQTLF